MLKNNWPRHPVSISWLVVILFDPLSDFVSFESMLDVSSSMWTLCVGNKFIIHSFEDLDSRTWLTWYWCWNPQPKMVHWFPPKLGFLWGNIFVEWILLDSGCCYLKCYSMMGKHVRLIIFTRSRIKYSKYFSTYQWR